MNYLVPQTRFLSPLRHIGRSPKGAELFDWSALVRLAVHGAAQLDNPLLSVTVATPDEWIGVYGAVIRVRSSVGEAAVPLPCRRVAIERVLVRIADVLRAASSPQEIEVTIEGPGAQTTRFCGTHVEDDFAPSMKSRVQGVSYPRSGHHMLEDALRRYFDCRFRYCEQFTTCGRRPCVDPLTTLQKDHDVYFTVPADEPRDYLIQYRHPLYSISSHYEYQFRGGTFRGVRESKEAWRKYAVNEAELWKRWVTKWVIANDGPSVCRLAYEDVLRNPERSLARVIDFVCPGHAVDNWRLRCAVAHVRRHTPRRLTAFKYYDEGFFRSLEGQVADEVEAVGLGHVLIRTRRPRAA